MLTLEGKELKIKVNPAWDLAWEELVFPLLVGRYEIYLHMKPYPAQDLKDLLADINTTVVPEGDELTIVPGNSKKLPFFFWKHYNRLSGITVADGEPTDEQQRRFIQRKPSILEATVMGGYGNLKRVPRPEGNPEDQLQIDLETSNEIEVSQVLFLSEFRTTTKITMTHILEEPTHTNSLAYKNATRQSRMNRRKQGWYRILNYDIIEQLYNQLIVRIVGMLINGVACTEKNREDWLGLIPFWHKLFILTELFDEIEAKNV